MSNTVLNRAWRVTGLRVAEKFVLVALADAANGDGQCWPKMKKLAEMTGLSLRSVKRSVAALDRADHLSRNRKGRRGYDYDVHPGGPNASRGDTAESRQNLSATGQKVPSEVTQSPLGTGRRVPSIEPSKNPQRTVVSRAREIPDDWKPGDFEQGSESAKVVASWSVSERAAQLEQFKAHHASKGNKFVDCQKAWSNWVLNSRRFGTGKREPTDDDKKIARWKALGRPTVDHYAEFQRRKQLEEDEEKRRKQLEKERATGAG